MPIFHSSAADAGVPPSHLWPRWLFLRALGLIFLSAFYSFAFQIHGLIGERGILPAGEYLAAVRGALGPAERFWYAPTLLWLSAGDRALTIVVAAGIVCSVLLTLDVWPKLTVALCTLLFLSCVAALQDFSSYQSDGMLLEAGFLSWFFAPSGVRPGLGAHDPPSRFSRFMLEWEWFRIYFESGIVKLASGDPHWRNLTAMDEYYQNGPLPTWLGWYVQHFPHWYHAATVVITFAVELVIVWAVFLPRRFRIACFVIVTALQIGIIATANYGFLNYLVLVLGVLLLDDRVLARAGLRTPATSDVRARSAIRQRVEPVVLGVVLYATIAAFLPLRAVPLLGAPSRLLDPFRIANAYGLFAVMTEGRYEIEFQGSRDGTTWIAYPFRYKPQDPMERPGIYAPYQPRFDWNLWFASLGPWEQSPWVVRAQERLVEGSPSVLRLFRRDPFEGKPPALVRTVLWQYWFTDLATKRRTGAWWRRKELGVFTGVVGVPRDSTSAPGASR
ncbi:MAG TPA: lipase maturation factor family protein [Gemmatimonadaceae bacterium]|nr:lipase maturation factor family protein [Gemmatimonadaceae bacterium]